MSLITPQNLLLQLLCILFIVLYLTTPELKNFTEVYLDDILMHTKDLESHQAVFDQICQNFICFGLAINLHKSIFAGEKLNYIGFEVSADGCLFKAKPCELKVKPI